MISGRHSSTITKSEAAWFSVPRFPVADDPRLSLKAVGLLVYLLSRPEGWQFYRKDIVNRHSDGMDGVKSALKELRRFGYLTMTPDLKGGWDWEVFWTPVDNPPTPPVENPADGKTHRIENNKDLVGSSTEGSVDLFSNGNGTPPGTGAPFLSNATLHETFEDLWVLHRKGVKKDAIEHYKAILRSGEATHDTLYLCLGMYVESFGKDFNGAHLWRWLRDKRWQEFEHLLDSIGSKGSKVFEGSTARFVQ